MYEIANVLPEFLEERGFTAEPANGVQESCSSLLNPEVKPYYRDYVSNHEENEYQSLHITFYDNSSRSYMEVQLRTKMMDDVAEIGAANHRVYEKKQEKEQTTEFELTEIVKRPILEKIPEDKRPLENPALQITGTYFMQELRREVPMEEKENIKELEEEMAANLVKSKFMIAVEKPQEGKTEEEQKKEALKVFYLKSKEDKFMLPIFTAVSYTHLRAHET